MKHKQILYPIFGLLVLIMVAFLPIGGKAETANIAVFQQIDYRNCSLLYAVQPADNLEEIADFVGTSEEVLMSWNNLDDADEIFTGMVLCIESSGITFPPRNERSGVEVIDVSPDQAVTVRGLNFPAGESLNVYIFQRGVGNPNVVQLDSIIIPASGEFERSFDIPDDLRSFRNMIIRFRNPDENISASATFINADVERITPEDCAEYYTVRSGDFLSFIAQEFNVSIERLVEINNLVDANLVLPGQMLCIELD